MLTVQVALHLLMLCVWWVDATVGGAGNLRWAALAIAVPVALLARNGSPRSTRLPRGFGVLLVLAAYGVAIGFRSEAPVWALTKCMAYAATSLVFLSGGVSLVERFGRDRVLLVWRMLWRALLAYSVVAVGLGLWKSGPEGLYGPTGNPNMFGSILLSMGLILCIPVKAENNLIRLAEIGIGGALLVATRSRASLGGVLLGAAMAILLYPGLRRWAWAAAILVITTSVVLSRSEQAISNLEVVAEGSTLGEVTRSRSENWERSWEAMKAGLPFGLGWGVKDGMKSEWSLSIAGRTRGREEGTSWLPIGEELGIPGFVLFAWLWVGLVRAVAVAPVRSRVAGGAALTTYFVLATFEGWLLSPGNWESAAFWTTLGILLARPSESGVLSVPAPLQPAVPAFGGRT